MKKLSPSKVNKISLILFLAGIVILLIGGFTEIIPLVFLGTAVCFAGMIFRLVCYICPHCGAYLGRITGYCPHCGKKVKLW